MKKLAIAILAILAISLGPPLLGQTNDIGTLESTKSIVTRSNHLFSGEPLISTLSRSLVDKFGKSAIDAWTPGSLIMEGATSDAYELTLAITDPTADRTITFPDATGTVLLSTAPSVASALTVTASSANALAVGRQGATAPALNVASNTTNSATGIGITAAAAAGGVAVAAISSGTNESMTIDAKGSGAVTLQSVGTGGVVLADDVLIGTAKTLTFEQGTDDGYDTVITAATNASVTTSATLPAPGNAANTTNYVAMISVKTDTGNPESGVAGQFLFNVADDKIFYWDGDSWALVIDFSPQ